MNYDMMVVYMLGNQIECLLKSTKLMQKNYQIFLHTFRQANYQLHLVSEIL